MHLFNKKEKAEQTQLVQNAIDNLLEGFSKTADSLSSAKALDSNPTQFQRFLFEKIFQQTNLYLENINIIAKKINDPHIQLLKKNIELLLKHCLKITTNNDLVFWNDLLVHFAALHLNLMTIFTTSILAAKATEYSIEKSSELSAHYLKICNIAWQMGDFSADSFRTSVTNQIKNYEIYQPKHTKNLNLLIQEVKLKLNDFSLGISKNGKQEEKPPSIPPQSKPSTSNKTQPHRWRKQTKINDASLSRPAAISFYVPLVRKKTLAELNQPALLIIEPRLNLLTRVSKVLSYLWKPSDPNNLTPTTDEQKLSYFFLYFFDQIKTILKKEGFSEQIEAIEKCLKDEKFKTQFFYGPIAQDQNFRSAMIQNLEDNNNFAALFTQLKEANEKNPEAESLSEITNEDMNNISNFFKGLQFNFTNKISALKDDRKVHYRKILNEFSDIAEAIQEKIKQSFQANPRPTDTVAILGKDLIDKLKLLFNDWTLLGFANNAGELTTYFIDARFDLLQFLDSKEPSHLLAALTNFYSLINIKNDNVKVNGWKFNENSFNPKSNPNSKDPENKKVIPTLEELGKNIKSIASELALALSYEVTSTTTATENENTAPKTSVTLSPNQNYIHQPKPYLQSNEDTHKLKKEINADNYVLKPRDIEAAWEIIVANAFKNLSLIDFSSSEGNNLASNLAAEKNDHEATTAIPELLIFKIRKATKEWALLAGLPPKGFVYLDPDLNHAANNDTTFTSIHADILLVYPEATLIDLSARISPAKPTENSGLHLIAAAEILVEFFKENNYGEQPFFDNQLTEVFSSLIKDNNEVALGKYVKKYILQKISQEEQATELKNIKQNIVTEILILNQKLPNYDEFERAIKQLFEKLDLKITAPELESNFIQQCKNIALENLNADSPGLMQELTLDDLKAFAKLLQDNNSNENAKLFILGTYFASIKRLNEREDQRLPLINLGQDLFPRSLDDLEKQQTDLSAQIDRLALNPKNEEVKEYLKEIKNYFLTRKANLIELFEKTLKTNSTKQVEVETPPAKQTESDYGELPNFDDDLTTLPTPTLDEVFFSNPPSVTTSSSASAPRKDSQYQAIPDLSAVKTGSLFDTTATSTPVSNQESNYQEIPKNLEVRATDIANRGQLLPAELRTPLESAKKKVAIAFGADAAASAYLAQQKDNNEILALLLENRKTRNKALLISGTTIAVLLGAAVLSTVFTVGAGSVPFWIALTIALSIDGVLIGYANHIYRANKKLFAQFNKSMDTIASYFTTNPDTEEKTNCSSPHDKATRSEIFDAISSQLLLGNLCEGEEHRLSLVIVIHKLLKIIKAPGQPFKIVQYQRLENTIARLANLALIEGDPGFNRLAQLFDQAIQSKLTLESDSLSEEKKLAADKFDDQCKTDQLVLWMNKIYETSKTYLPNGKPDVKELKSVLQYMDEKNLAILIDRVLNRPANQNVNPELNPVVRLLLTTLRKVSIQDILARRAEEMRENVLFDGKDSSFQLIQTYNKQRYNKNNAGISVDLNFVLDQINKKNKSSDTAKSYLAITAELLDDLDNLAMTMPEDNVTPGAEELFEMLLKEEKGEKELPIFPIIKDISADNLGKLLTAIITGEIEPSETISKAILKNLTAHPTALQTSLINARNDMGSSRKFISTIQDRLLTLEEKNPNTILDQLLLGFERKQMPLLKGDADKTLIDILTAHDEYYRTSMVYSSNDDDEEIKRNTRRCNATYDYINNIENKEQKKHFNDYYRQTPYYILTKKGRISSDNKSLPTAKEVRHAFETLLIPVELSALLSADETDLHLINNLFLEFSNEPDQKENNFVLYMESFATSKVDQYSLEIRKLLIVNFLKQKRDHILSEKADAIIAKWFSDIAKNNKIAETIAPFDPTLHYLDVFASLQPKESFELLANMEKTEPGLAGKIMIGFFELSDGATAEHIRVTEDLLRCLTTKTYTNDENTNQGMIFASILGELYQKAKKGKNLNHQFADGFFDLLTVSEAQLKKSTTPLEERTDKEKRMWLLSHAILSIKNGKMPKKDTQAILQLLFENGFQLDEDLSSSHSNVYALYLASHQKINIASQEKQLADSVEQTRLGGIFSFRNTKPDYKNIALILDKDFGDLGSNAFRTWVNKIILETHKLYTYASTNLMSQFFIPKLITGLLHSNMENKDQKIIATLKTFLRFLNSFKGDTQEPTNKRISEFLAVLKKHATKVQLAHFYNLISKDATLLSQLLPKAEIAASLKKELGFISDYPIVKFLKDPKKSMVFFASADTKEGTANKHFDFTKLREPRYTELNIKLANLVKALHQDNDPAETNYITDMLGTDKDKIKFHTKLLMQAIWLNPPEEIEISVTTTNTMEIPKAQKMTRAKNIFTSILSGFFEQYNNALIKSTKGQNINSKHIEHKLLQGISDIESFVISEFGITSELYPTFSKAIKVTKDKISYEFLQMMAIDENGDVSESSYNSENMPLLTRRKSYPDYRSSATSVSNSNTPEAQITEDPEEGSLLRKNRNKNNADLVRLEENHVETSATQQQDVTEHAPKLPDNTNKKTEEDDNNEEPPDYGSVIFK